MVTADQPCKGSLLILPSEHLDHGRESHLDIVLEKKNDR
jgi:hypothetical protein